MTPKKLILFTSAILGTMGVLVSVIIIAIGGGFSGPGPSLLNPPSAKDLWAVGDNLSNGLELNYSLTDQSIVPLNTKEDVSMSLAYCSGNEPCSNGNFMGLYPEAHHRVGEVHSGR